MAEHHPCQPHFCDDCDRFAAWYRITGDEAQARQRAFDLCLEQTVEFPQALLPAGFIPDEVVGQVDRVVPVAGSDGKVWRALITFLNDNTGGELTQFLNTLYGNISLKKGFRLDGLMDCPPFWNRFRGPRFGRAGLRKRLGVTDRPLLCTAVKPLGLPAESLARMAGDFAAGGIDIIKDDHGLANQPFASFVDRVERCCDAVAEASHKVGRPILYAPNITAPAGELEERASLAKALGAGALLVCPGLVGFDSMRAMADDATLGLPIIAHPAFLGTYVTSDDNGISHGVLFGQLMRLAGADVSIYPHFGGRFGFSAEECRAIVKGAGAPMGRIAPLLPAPAGGMTMDRLGELVDFYGRDIELLIGGDLVRQGPDLQENARRFVAAVTAAAAAAPPAADAPA